MNNFEEMPEGAIICDGCTGTGEIETYVEDDYTVDICPFCNGEGYILDVE